MRIQFLLLIFGHMISCSDATGARMLKDRKGVSSEIFLKRKLNYERTCKWVRDTIPRKYQEQLTSLKREIRENDLDGLTMLFLIQHQEFFKDLTEDQRNLLGFLFFKDFGFSVSLIETDEKLLLFGLSVLQECENSIVLKGKRFYFPFSNIYDTEFSNICVHQKGSDLDFFNLSMVQDKSKSKKITRNILFEDDFFEIDLYLDSLAVSQAMKIPYIYWSKLDSLSYFPPSSILKNSLQEIEKLISGFSLQKKLAFLLSFCQQQKHFDDRLLFGEEKFLSPESTLWSEGADCDDKSLLLCFLLKEILDIDSIMIIYPDSEHVNVGVLAREVYKDKRVDYLNYREKNYVIFEPSGLWYPPGKQMEGIETKGYKVLSIHHHLE